MKKFYILFAFLVIQNVKLFAAEAGMPQLDPKYWASQAFWLVIIFTSIYLLVAKIFIPKIKSNIDSRENKIRKDLEEAKIHKEQSEKKLEEYNNLIKKGEVEARKILSESRQKLSEDMQIKKEEIQKEIEKEIKNAEEEIKKFSASSMKKINEISEDITSKLVKDIFGEDLNRSSLNATISEVTKNYREEKK